MITISRADLALIQDRGRTLFADQGVPRSGAWDLVGYERACALIGSPGAPCFELLDGTFTARVDTATTVAAVGSFESGEFAHSFTVPAGGEVSLVVRRGPAYLAVQGLQVAAVLGSAASDLVSGLGPERLAPGMHFPSGGVSRPAQLRYTPPSGAIGFIGADLPRRWQVRSQSRSGTRLQPLDPWVAVESARTLPSRPMLPGAIQIVSEREAIVLGPDSGVTGGYRVAGVVCTADVGRLARLREGEELVLESIDLVEACARHRRTRAFELVRLNN